MELFSQSVQVKTTKRNGKESLRRLRIDEALEISISSVLALIPREQRQNIRVFLDVESLTVNDKGEGIEIKLEIVKQCWNAKHYFFRCPRCNRRCKNLYIVVASSQKKEGCRYCFGLTYLSRQGHKTHSYDVKLSRKIIDRYTRARGRAVLRETNRRAKLWNSIYKLAKD